MVPPKRSRGRTQRGCAGRSAGKRKRSSSAWDGSTQPERERRQLATEQLKEAFLQRGIPEEPKLRQRMRSLPDPASELVSSAVSSAQRRLSSALHAYCLGGCSCLAVHGAGSKKLLLEHAIPNAVPGGIATFDSFRHSSPSPRDVALEALRAVPPSSTDPESDASGFDFDEVLELLDERLQSRQKYRLAQRPATSTQHSEPEPERWVTVIVHSADWRSMRGRAMMQGLASLSTLPGLGLVLSFDHINASALLNTELANKMRLMWVHTTTYRWFKEEGEHVGTPIFSSKAEQSAAMDASSVLSGLTPNAQKIFKILGDEQVHYGKNFEGMSVSDWYERCRTRFLVSSEPTLRAHLNEFLDHELVTVKRSQMGADLVLIPLATHAISSLLSFMSID